MTTLESNSRRESINCEFCINPLRGLTLLLLGKARKRSLLSLNRKVVNCFVPSPPHSFERLLFTPATGYRNSTTGAFGGIGSTGAIWSSSAFADGSYNVSRLFFVESLVHPLRSVYRSYGFSVRCVQASAAKPLSPPILQPAPPRHQKPAYRATGRRKTGHPRMHGRPRHAPCTKKPRGGILRANKRARVEPPTDAGAATDPARP